MTIKHLKFTKTLLGGVGGMNDFQDYSSKITWTRGSDLYLVASTL